MVTTEEATVDAIPLQKRESPDSARHAANADREGSTLVVPEKPSEDGYNWRKYGQKNVKGNKLVRSYYKCSYHNCFVKKQVERAHDGRITDTSYFGKHDHPKPPTGLAMAVPSVLSVKVQTMDNRSSVVVDEIKQSNEPSTVPTCVEGTQDADSPLTATKEYANSDDNLVSKRRKKGVDDAMSMDDKPSSELRRVVETVSAVDVVNDGYRWRKYGQKLVKDNPNARSYYRCSNPGCPAKKRVERAFNDPRVVITTYQGYHDHVVPPVKALVSHSNSTAASIAGNGVNNKPEEINRAQNSASICKQEQGNTIELPAKKDDPPEVNQAQSSGAICREEQGHAIEHPAEEGDLPEVNQAQTSAATYKQEQVNTTDHPAEKDDPPEVHLAQSSAAICKQEHGNTIDHPSEKDDPPEVNQARSSAVICKQEQGNTTDHPAEKGGPSEVRAQSSAAICKQEQGNTSDHPAEKNEPPANLMQECDNPH